MFRRCCEMVVARRTPRRSGDGVGPSCIDWIATAELSGCGMMNRSGQSGAARRMLADLRTWFAVVSVGDGRHTQDPGGSLQSADSALDVER